MVHFTKLLDNTSTVKETPQGEQAQTHRGEESKLVLEVTGGF